MPLESHVDVLIIGAGPAGLMCANALAVADVNVKIIDKRSTKVMVGHADGIQARALEVLQSYGLAERLIREGNQLHSFTFYNPGLNGGIECTGRVFEVNPSSARFPFQITLHQGATEAIFLDSMNSHGVEVERLRQPLAIEVSDDVDELSSPSSFPVKVTLAHLGTDGEKIDSEIIHAKFVVGADGANSWVRKTLGIAMIGEQTEYVWGVIDIIAETNFPDIRSPSVIHSTSGTCLLIPRERDIVRLYVQLSDTDLVDPSTEKVDVEKVSPEILLSLARKIFHPFKLAAPKEIEWWTVYSIKQCVASSYSVDGRAFIVGDACHTHSAKAGQGMNAGINDSHNLAWKLAQVVREWSRPSLLRTYEHERRQFAQELINFDKNIAARMSAKPGTTRDEDNINNERFYQLYREFTSGIGIHYSPSAIVDAKHQSYAQNLIVGKRMLSQLLLRAADLCPTEIHDMLPADIRFKVLFFVGNLTDKRITELTPLAEELSKPSSNLRRHSADGNISTAFDIITIAADKKGDINYLAVPTFFRPHWSKVLLDDTDVTGKGGRAYERFGIDPKEITLVIVRPDGYVGAIAPSTALADLDDYFGSFMVSREPITTSHGVKSKL